MGTSTNLKINTNHHMLLSFYAPESLVVITTIEAYDEMTAGFLKP
jgi:hypothetical protein